MSEKNQQSTSFPSCDTCCTGQQKAAKDKRNIVGVSDSSKKPFLRSLAIVGIVAVCCFTPLLVIVLGVLGLGAVILYLDYILFPLLAVVVAATIFFYIRWQKSNS